MGNHLNVGRQLKGQVTYDDIYIEDILKGFDDDDMEHQDYLPRIIRQSDDAPWILSSAFMILTMQTGFAMRKYCVN